MRRDPYVRYPFAQLELPPDSPKTKLSGLKSLPIEPALVISIVPGYRSTRIDRAEYLDLTDSLKYTLARSS